MDSSARHQRLTDIYLEACDLQGEERMAYLTGAVGMISAPRGSGSHAGQPLKLWR